MTDVNTPSWIERSTLATSGPNFIFSCILEGYLVDFLSLWTISRFLVIPRHSASVLVFSRRDLVATRTDERRRGPPWETPKAQREMPN